MFIAEKKLTGAISRYYMRGYLLTCCASFLKALLANKYIETERWEAACLHQHEFKIAYWCSRWFTVITTELNQHLTLEFGKGISIDCVLFASNYACIIINVNADNTNTLCIMIFGHWPAWTRISYLLAIISQDKPWFTMSHQQVIQHESPWELLLFTTRLQLLIRPAPWWQAVDCATVGQSFRTPRVAEPGLTTYPPQEQQQMEDLCVTWQIVADVGWFNITVDVGWLVDSYISSGLNHQLARSNPRFMMVE